MSIPRITKAMEYIDDDLVSGAVTYTRQKRKWWKNWKAIAACVAVVALLFGAILFLNNGPTVSPFVLTAYAMEPDNSVSASTICEGESAPVSLFESKSGLKGFVFSCVINESWHPSAISIIPENKFSEHLGEIAGLSMENGRHYYYFIPEQHEVAPYKFMLSYTDTNNNTLYEFHISIDKSENGFNAVIDSVKAHEN